MANSINMAPGGLIFVMTIEVTDGAENDTIGKKRANLQDVIRNSEGSTLDFFFHVSCLACED